MLFSEFAAISGGQLLQLRRDHNITRLLTDSRKIIATPGSVFFAIKGVRHDGHDFVKHLYQAGIRNFVLEHAINIESFGEGNFLLVKSAVASLQTLASRHREEFTIPVIGITGSNGKTIVKEWIYQLLSPSYSCVKNPGSYNSQIGVPLSVWQMESGHEIGIFEAGISQPREMEKLAEVIKPTIGVLTNIGTAHDQGFSSMEQKLEEKLKLFLNARTLVYCEDHELVRAGVKAQLPAAVKRVSWGTSGNPNILLKFINDDLVSITGDHGEFTLFLPFKDKASRENLFHCIAVMLCIDVARETFQSRINSLAAVPMRLEMKEGINQCLVIDDTYNNDLGGLQLSLDFLMGVNQKKKTLIVSDILQSGSPEERWIDELISLIAAKKVDRVIAVGPMLNRQQHRFDLIRHRCEFFPSTARLIEEMDWSSFHSEAILVKGARTFGFEEIVKRLQKKFHGTVMEVDLDAVAHNLNFYRSCLKPGVKLMAMVKAFAYGSGSAGIANLMQFHKVDYLGVAYTDEGLDLRRSGITLPIMVMNPSVESFESMLEKKLEPEIYSLPILDTLVSILKGREFFIHLKLETGMNRLGLSHDDLVIAVELLRAHPHIHVVSVFSHLAGADDPSHDDFSRQQIEDFKRSVQVVKTSLGIDPICHILNTSGIMRFPDAQFDMVRLGIGLYGIDPTGTRRDQLKPAATLKTTISQVKTVGEGETIGYGRKGVASHPMRIATVAIGYADGYPRSFSQGKGYMLVEGKPTAVVGNICMDMTMIDITAIPHAKEGDEVIVFGKELPIETLASRINTIPYELLTNTSDRVKRVFLAQSI